MPLRDLNLRYTYSSDTHNLVEDFYNPVLESARFYDRITGYYSPKVFALASRGFAHFLHHQGKIRLLTSVQVDQATFDALKKYDEQLTEVPSEILPGLDLAELRTQLEKDYYDVFVHLLHSEKLELRIAATTENVGILHQKVGIITDVDGDAISFSGSNNETAFGWSKNIEKFKVFPSWQEATSDYYEDDVKGFYALWNGKSDSVCVMTVSEALKQASFQLTQPDVSIKDKIDRIEEEESPSNPVDVVGSTSDPSGNDNKIAIRPYQKDAINAWSGNNYYGLFEMATGTGKTITGLAAIDSFYKIQGKLFCVIAVPLRHLVPQWMEDIEKFFPNARIIKVGGDYPTWRDELPRQVRQFYKGKTKQVIVVTTYASMGVDDFTNIMTAYDNDYCLLADEAHNAGTDRTLEVVSVFKYRLGLSATLRNKWAGIDKDELIKAFGGIVYSYPLKDAIKNGVLVPYDYHPIVIYLNDVEAQEYITLSHKISVAMNYNEDNKNSNAVTALLNQRSSIMKNAEEKGQVLEGLVKKLHSSEEYKKMLVYCDNQSQIAEAQQILDGLNINSSKITFKESLPERWQLLGDFAIGFVDALVARKCLDEGVNIPSTRTAILVASNTDSREYIQRLGRVLRTYQGKDKAVVYDFVVLPPYSEDSSRYKYLLRSELERVAFFEEDAINSEEVVKFRNDIETRYNIQQEIETDVQND